ncbi:MAG: AhpC/TSA family protein [Alphaproteobacteria bacterium]|nr:AhpC/TSA family protein [Alphaproteobacteria bacterium]MCB9794517.1 AhpC/TSA family protein [Alphaproteobacteria bacterium]
MAAQDGLEMNATAPAALAEALVIPREGAPLPLGALWGEGPSLTVFLRHFGCVGCNMNVSDLAPRLHELDRLGVRVVLLGNGERAHLEGFIERFKLEGKPASVATDPSLGSFALAGMIRSRWVSAGPPGIWDRLYGLSQGYANGLLAGQAPIQGDNTQQGGALLLDAERRVVYLHRNPRISGFARATDILDAALRMRARELIP